MQGTSHQAMALPCQDAHVCRTLTSGETIIALADGAGSAACAAEGAGLAAVRVTEALAERLAHGRPGHEAGWHTLLLYAYEAAQTAVYALARAAGRPARAYASTLTCAVLAGPWFVTAQLGDGLIVACAAAEPGAACDGAGGGLFLAARPQRGEYANEAYFLTQGDALAYVDVLVWQRPVAAVAASTDGLLRLALQLPGYEPYAPFFRPLFRYLAGNGNDAAVRAGLLGFLASPRLCARTDDDKTLVLAVQTRAETALREPAPLALAWPARGADAMALSLDEWWGETT